MSTHRRDSFFSIDSERRCCEPFVAKSTGDGESGTNVMDGGDGEEEVTGSKCFDKKREKKTNGKTRRKLSFSLGVCICRRVAGRNARRVPSLSLYGRVLIRVRRRRRFVVANARVGSTYNRFSSRRSTQ